MTKGAVYNEIDPVAAEWLRTLIACGEIAPGVVDERSIEDVRPDDYRGFTQVHLFAGIGIWSAALRRVGWADNWPIWSCSCPCQPFSAAGKGDGFTDERHLWPAAFHLITSLRPERLVGEQVASRDGLTWFDLVSADLEGADYAPGIVDLCAAGVGAPNLRQRLWWEATTLDNAASARRLRPFLGAESLTRDETRLRVLGERRGYGGVANAGMPGHPGGDGVARDGGGAGGWQQGTGSPIGCGYTGVGQADATGGRCGIVGDAPHAGGSGHLDGGVGPSGLGGAPSEGREGLEDGRGALHRQERQASERTGGQSIGLAAPGPGPVNGLWGDADWLYCRDEKWRPVEGGTFPLAHGDPGRVGRLRAYGNSLNLEAAVAFCNAALWE